MDPFEELRRDQDGVVARRQLLELGLSRVDVERLVRRRELVPVHPGVYVDHTGELTWRQRCWAATLYAGRSALHLDAALAPSEATEVIDVAIDATRRVQRQRGLRLHRVTDLEDKVRWNTSPPRVRVEHAALAKAHRARTDLDAIGALAREVGGRRTTAERLREAYDARWRLARRALLGRLLDDLAAGTHSVLEHGYLTRVLRPHHIPEPSERQAWRQGAGGAEYRDAEHADQDVHVELDGAWHDGEEQTDRDADRDLADLADGRITVRLRYRQVYGTPCRTAGLLGRFLASRGWTGRVRPCGPGCDAVT